MVKKEPPKNVKKQLQKKSKQQKRKSSLMLALDELLGLKAPPQNDAVVSRSHISKSSLSPEERLALKHYEEGIQKTLDLIAPAGMEVKRNEVTLNNLHARTYFVYNWPSYIFPNWLSPTINYDAEMDIAHFIYPVSNKAIMKMLRKKVAEMRSSIRMLEQRGVVRDPSLEAALQDAEELRDLLARGQEKLYQFGMYVTVYSEDEEKLKKMEADLESLLGGKLVMTKPAVFQMEHAWLSTLPFCQDELEVTRNMNTSPLATSFPFTSSDLTDDHGIMYGINRHNDSLVIFDRFDLANANATVFATSGAGKSFTVKLEILRSMMFGTEVFIIDPENEYVNLAKTVGGTFIPISLQSNNSINPFDLPKAIRGEEARPGEVLRAAVITLHGLFKLMLGTLTPAEDGILDKAILDTYALKDISLDTKDYSDKEPPTMHELVDVLMTTNGGENMAQTLTKYTEGAYAGIFDKHTSVQMENQLVVFQIRDLEESLRPVAMYVVLNFLWSSIRADMKRRFLVIDEAWNLMQHDDSARFLYGLIKRARKYYLGVTTITQDVEDFVNSPYGKPIVTNAQMQVLLKQSPTAVDNLQKLFYLTDGEKYLLLNSDVGQGLFFAGNKHVAIQVVASPEEAAIITTKPEEVMSGKTDAKDTADGVAEQKIANSEKEERAKGKPPEERESSQGMFKTEKHKKALDTALGRTETKKTGLQKETASATESKKESEESTSTDIQTSSEKEHAAVADTAPKPATPEVSTGPVDPFDSIDPVEDVTTPVAPKTEKEKPLIAPVEPPPPPSLASTEPPPPPVDPFDEIDPIDDISVPAMYASSSRQVKQPAAPVAEKAKEPTKIKKRNEEEITPPNEKDPTA
ncbi:conjugal transfer protein TraC [Candidatus Peregrinibacteria bacterium CG10_big_fil_rev_8_21_14_0_10_49_24]|nr:MAG: conjugal transfer protein TraC [Candidatus Peregrinibacteria bacterium CG11_big_fil_rev_8_21_14_0_20_49_14]PIR51136.1 MAG: conjugal transfer protein TraC [Candidatus Peregrinibacteria bacterium CG10_big_fil_rev_8_21_14_0_10_49_24]